MKNNKHSARLPWTKRKNVHGGGTFGFSLVELIVVIAVLAVLAIVLVPTLTRYVESSRAQKDVSAMDEVVNAVQLSMSEQDCYDEMYRYSCANNYLTYTDSSGKYGQQLNDGEYWAPDGSGRATTITFNPIKDEFGKTYYSLDRAIINDMTYDNGSVAQSRTMEGSLIKNNQCYLKNASVSDGDVSAYLYNSIKKAIGTDVIATSATYKNSSYTIFIKFDKNDDSFTAHTTGAFNGTNLHEGAKASVGSHTSRYEDNDLDKPIAGKEGGTIDATFTNSDLQGGGSISVPSDINSEITDYKQDAYIDALQKENTFEYYSSAALASRDVSNSTIGRNADVNKEDAVAGVFIDENNVPTVLILKDNNETERIRFNVKANLVLGGHKLYFRDPDDLAGGLRANMCVDMLQGGTIDGRASGSALIQRTMSNTKSGCVQTSGDVVINGGEYIVENSYVSSGFYSFGNGTCEIKNATLNLKCSKKSGVATNISNAIETHSTKTIVDSCTINVSSETHCRGFNCFTSTIIKNSKIVATSSVNMVESDLKFSYGVQAQNGANIDIQNCDIYGSLSGISLNNINNATIKNTKSVGVIRGGLYAENSVAKIENSSMSYGKIINGSLNTVTEEKVAIAMHSSNIYAHGCDFTGKDNSMYLGNNSNLYISSSKIKTDKLILLNGGSKLYLGSKNNFDANDCTPSSSVVVTNETYKGV